MADRTISVRLQALTDQYRREMDRAGKSTSDTGRKVEGTTGGVGMLGGAVRKLIPVLGVAGLGRAFGQSVQAAADFENSLVKMETLVGLTGGQVEELSSGFADLSRETGLSAQELADASFFISSAGLRGADALDALEASAKASAIGLGEVNVVADLVTSAMNAYGPEVLDAGSATDVLVAAVRAGKAEAPQLASALGQVLPIASEMGVSFDEVGAAVAAMTRTGTDASQATTQLRGILMALLRPAQQSEEAMREFGLSGEMLRTTLQEQGLLATLELLRGTFDGNEEALARVIPRAEGLMGVLDLMGSNVDDTRQIFGDLSDSAGASEEAMGRYSETTQFQMERASAAWQNLKVNVVEDVMPAVTTAMEYLADKTEEGIGSAIYDIVTLSDVVDNMAEFYQGIDWSAWFTGDAFANAGNHAEDVEGHLAALKAQGDQYVDGLVAQARQNGRTGDSMDGLSDNIGDLEDQVEDTRTSMERLIDTFHEVIGVNTSVERANLRVLEGWDSLTEGLKENGATLDENTEKGRANRELILDQTDSVIGLLEAQHEQGASIAEVSEQYEGHIAQLQDVMRENGLTEDQIASYIDTLGLTPDEVISDIIANSSNAEDAMLEYIRLTGRIPRDITTNVRLSVQRDAYDRAINSVLRTGENQFMHTGGYISQSGKIQRFHSGGQVGAGLRADEVPAILQTGEVVLSRKQVSLLSQALSPLPQVDRLSGQTSGSQPAGTTVDIVVNNPTAEPASTSISRAMRTMQYAGVFA